VAIYDSRLMLKDHVQITKILFVTDDYLCKSLITW